MLNIGGLFRKSPFEPLRAHRDQALAAGKGIEGLVRACLAGESETLTKLSAEISDHEARADEIMNDIRSVMPSDVRLPISRRDFLRVVSAQDDIADAAKKLAVLCAARPLTLPSSVAAAFTELAGQVDQAVASAEELLLAVDALVDAGFGGPAAEQAMADAEDTERTAEIARESADAVLQLLFADGDALSHVDLLLASRVVDGLAEAAKATRHVAGRLRLILAQ